MAASIAKKFLLSVLFRIFKVNFKPNLIIKFGITVVVNTAIIAKGKPTKYANKTLQGDTFKTAKITKITIPKLARIIKEKFLLNHAFLILVQLICDQFNLVLATGFIFIKI